MDLVRHTINTRDHSSGFVALTDDLGAADEIAGDYLSDADEGGDRRYERVWIYRVAPGADTHNVTQSLAKDHAARAAAHRTPRTAGARDVRR